MKLAVCLGAAALALLGLASATEQSVTPVEQVVRMLTDMKSQGESAKATEASQMASYSDWFKGRIADLEFEARTSASQIEELQATAAKEDSRIATLTGAIAELDGEIARMEKELADAKQQRDTEHSDYLKAQTDYSESVDALRQAIQVIKAQAYDRPQAEALLQKMAQTVPGMQHAFAAFLEQKARARQAPAAAAYEFQSDNIIQVLEQLLEKFEDELQNLEKQETNADHAHQLEALHGSNTVAQLKGDREEKAQLKGEAVAAAAVAKGQLAEAQADLAETQKLLQDTKTTFAAKSSAFESNQRVRTEELQALEQAIAILSSPEVADSYSRHVKLVQTGARRVAAHAPSFLQERSQSASARAVARTQVAQLLKNKATLLSSKLLASAAEQVAANPFAKVIQLIEGLLAKLKEEAAAEATHKQWCDQELAANQQQREKHASDVDRHRATVEMLGTEIQTMAAEMATLAEEQANIAKALSEATTARQQEKAKNEATLKDAEAAQEALKRAVAILRDFYSKQGSPQASLLQRRQVPEMAAYRGLQGNSPGVLGMLEVIQSDFARLEADTRAAEAQAASEYAAFAADAEATQKQKHERHFKLQLDKDQAEFEQSRVKKDLDYSETELAAANRYFEELKPACIQVHVSYEERVARRQEEIEALRQAYKILDGVQLAA